VFAAQKFKISSAIHLNFKCKEKGILLKQISTVYGSNYSTIL
jgi:hypothetical protein